MQYVFIALSVGSAVFGICQAIHVLSAYFRLEPEVSIGAAIVKPLYAGIGIGLAFWFAALAGFAL